jgi:DNA polymerase III subunit chi
MKPRVDLYLVNADSFDGCLPFLCTLTEKAYQQGYSLQVQLESAAMAQAFDQLLWTFRPASFVPHQLDSTDTVGVCKADSIGVAPSLLIRCHLPESPTPLSIARLLQIVPNQESLRECARRHYRFYQQQRYLLTTHNT